MYGENNLVSIKCHKAFDMSMPNKNDIGFNLPLFPNVDQIFRMRYEQNTHKSIPN